MFEFTILLVIIVILGLALLLAVWRFHTYQKNVDDIILQRFETWKNQELESQLALKIAEWKIKEVPKIREDAIKLSSATIKGNITQHLVPYFDDFPYHPQDIRFIGTPIDFIVFDGLSGANDLRSIVFLEIKTGKSRNLSESQKKVKRYIASGSPLTFETYPPK